MTAKSFMYPHIDITHHIRDPNMPWPQQLIILLYFSPKDLFPKFFVIHKHFRGVRWFKYWQHRGYDLLLSELYVLLLVVIVSCRVCMSVRQPNHWVMTVHVYSVAYQFGGVSRIISNMQWDRTLWSLHYTMLHILSIQPWMRWSTDCFRMPIIIHVRWQTMMYRVDMLLCNAFLVT